MARREIAVRLASFWIGAQTWGNGSVPMILEVYLAFYLFVNILISVFFSYACDPQGKRKKRS